MFLPVSTKELSRRFRVLNGMGVSMHEYEIRILKADRTTDLLIEVLQLTDRAAITAARKLAEARPCEVWRGMERIYARPRVKPARETG
jgi:hypothetical protein